MATKTHSVGVKLQYDSDGVSTYTDASDIISIDPPKAKADRSDTTHLLSTDYWRECIPGFLEAGNFSFTGYCAKTQYAILHTTIFAGRLSYYWRILFPLLSGESTNSRSDMYGFIGELGIETIQDEAVKFAGTVELSGAITWTSAT